MSDRCCHTHSPFPRNKYLWHEPITYFARVFGAARSGDIAAVSNNNKTLAAFCHRTVKAGEDYWAVHINVYREMIAAWYNYIDYDFLDWLAF